MARGVYGHLADVHRKARRYRQAVRDDMRARRPQRAKDAHRPAAHARHPVGRHGRAENCDRQRASPNRPKKPPRRQSVSASDRCSGFATFGAPAPRKGHRRIRPSGASARPDRRNPEAGNFYFCGTNSGVGSGQFRLLIRHEYTLKKGSGPSGNGHGKAGHEAPSS